MLVQAAVSWNLITVRTSANATANSFCKRLVSVPLTLLRGYFFCSVVNYNIAATFAQVINGGKVLNRVIFLSLNKICKLSAGCRQKNSGRVYASRRVSCYCPSCISRLYL